MQLKDYPRPPADNGWGFHSSSGAYEKPWMSKSWRLKFVGVDDVNQLTAAQKTQVLRDYSQMLHDEYGIRWFKLLASSDSQVDWCQALHDAGIEPIVRLWADRPHPNYGVAYDIVHQYVDAGVHYFEWGNEPNLKIEWQESAWNQGNQPRQVAHQAMINFRAVRDGGGIPCLPAMSPGGDINHRQFLSAFLDALHDMNALGILDGAVVAIHNRPHNLPVDVTPTDAMTVSFREYEWIDNLINSYIGQSLPLLGTESGYEIGDATVQGYPRITGELHAQYSMELFRSFKDKWRPALFCQNVWLIELYDPWSFSFANAAWWYNKVIGGAYPNSILPAVQALYQEPKFVRVMPWETGYLTLTIDWPANGAVVATDHIDVRGMVSIGGSLVRLRVNDTANYQALADDVGRFTLTQVALQEGDNMLSATATGPAGQTTPAPIVVRVMFQPGDPCAGLRQQRDLLRQQLDAEKRARDDAKAKMVQIRQILGL